MKIVRPNVSKKLIIESFRRNNITKYEIKEDYIDIEDSIYTKRQLEAIIRNFSFYDIFLWSDKGIENILLWEKPERIPSVVEEFELAFTDTKFQLLTSIEAKGFILGGILSAILLIPFLPIRKYKKIYENISGFKRDFINWKEERESLYLFENEFSCKRAVLVDDLLHTGNSLEASINLLDKANIEVVGAFYLADYTTQEVRQKFNFPIRSLLRQNDLLKNCY